MFFRVIAEACTLIDCKGYVWSGCCNKVVQLTDDRLVMKVLGRHRPRFRIFLEYFRSRGSDWIDCSSFESSWLNDLVYQVRLGQCDSSCLVVSYVKSQIRSDITKILKNILLRFWSLYGCHKFIYELCFWQKTDDIVSVNHDNQIFFVEDAQVDFS